MYAFENNLPAGRGFDSYWAALWWTLMIMTTMGSEFWHRTAEGRVLCVLLALHAFGVFGYVTAALAFFSSTAMRTIKKGAVSESDSNTWRGAIANCAALRYRIKLSSQSPDASRAGCGDDFDQSTRTHCRNSLHSPSRQMQGSAQNRYKSIIWR